MIVYRSVKGSALTSDEVDNNFEELYNTDIENDSLAVHLAGTETITGAKTFNLDIAFPDTKGVTWIGGSSIKENSGGLSIVTGALGVTVSSASITSSTDILFTASSRVIFVGTTWFSNGSYASIFDISALMANRQVVFPDKDITLAGVNNETFTGTTTFSSLTASTVPYLDASKNLVSSAVTPSQLGYLSGATGTTGTNLLVYGTSPTLVSPDVTTSLTTGSTTFALVNTTATTVNFAGAATTLNIGNSGGTNTILGANSFGGNITGATTTILSVGSDTDGTHILGRVKIGSFISSDFASFSHFDQAATTTYAMGQDSAGATYINAKTGQVINFRNNNSGVLTIGSTEVKVLSGKNFWLGNAAVTGLSAGALAATTNASIVIYDSAGQAYRIPCII
jgi:hypothetical protein